MIEHKGEDFCLEFTMSFTMNLNWSLVWTPDSCSCMSRFHWDLWPAKHCCASRFLLQHKVCVCFKRGRGRGSRGACIANQSRSQPSSFSIWSETAPLISRPISIKAVYQPRIYFNTVDSCLQGIPRQLSVKRSETSKKMRRGIKGRINKNETPCRRVKLAS